MCLLCVGDSLDVSSQKNKIKQNFEDRCSQNSVFILGQREGELLFCRAERVQGGMKRRGWNRGKPKRTQQKNKTLLGLVSNLQLLSSHQRKTAYSKGTVRSCLLKRITALKGSEEKQQCEFRCSCRVMRRVDLLGVIQWRTPKKLKNENTV